LPTPDPLTALYLEYQTYVTAPTLSAQKIGMPKRRKGGWSNDET
jgi:hypothetical protein